MTDDTTLHALLGRVALQDRAALHELYKASAGRLLAVAYRILNDRGAAEDVLQDTFLTVWTRAPQFPALRTSPLAWLTSIARNRSIDVLRKRRPETPLSWQDDDGDEHQMQAQRRDQPEQAPVDRAAPVDVAHRWTIGRCWVPIRLRNTQYVQPWYTNTTGVMTSATIVITFKV